MPTQKRRQRRKKNIEQKSAIFEEIVEKVPQESPICENQINKAVFASPVKDFLEKEQTVTEAPPKMEQLQEVVNERPKIIANSNTSKVATSKIWTGLSFLSIAFLFMLLIY